MKYLCKSKKIQEVEKLYLVAPPSFSCKVSEIQSFFPLDLPLQTNAKSTLLIGSTNDPYMKVSELKELQKSLNIELVVLENAGHINADSGYGPWEWMYQEVKKSLRVGI